MTQILGIIASIILVTSPNVHNPVQTTQLKTTPVIQENKVESIQITSKSKTIGYKVTSAAYKYKFTKEKKDKDTTDTFFWKSSKPKIASVNPKTGKITGKGVGDTTISIISSSMKFATQKVSVISIKPVIKDTPKLIKGVSYKAKVKLYNNKVAKWSSSNTKIAIVKKNGYVIGKKAGTVKIYAKSEQGEKVKAVTVQILNQKNIVDISYWQHTIDWNKASKYIDLPIVRATYTNGKSGYKYYDEYYPYNSTELAWRGKPFGVYTYDIFYNKKQARKMAKEFFKYATANGVRPTFFVLDIEETVFKKANVKEYIKTLREVASKVYGKKRVKVGVYVANHLYDRLKLDLKRTEKLDTPDFVWVPTYNIPETGQLGYYPPTKEVVDMWQYSSSAHIEGIKGKVDVNTLVDINKRKISNKSWFDFDWLTTK